MYRAAAGMQWRTAVIPASITSRDTSTVPPIRSGPAGEAGGMSSRARRLIPQVLEPLPDCLAVSQGVAGIERRDEGVGAGPPLRCGVLVVGQRRERGQVPVVGPTPPVEDLPERP